MSAQAIQQVKVDTVGVSQKKFSQDLSQKYTDEDFNYEDSVETQGQNFISRFLNWFFETLEDLFGISVTPGTVEIWKNIIYVVLILFGIYIIAKLLIGQGSGSVFGKANKTLTNFSSTEEHIEQIDFDQLLKEALQQKNYRLAVRYQYLKVLKLLSTKKIIEWHFEKTNQDYYQEIQPENLREGFQKVSYLYDYVWYGEFAIDESGYQRAENLFKELTKLSNRVR